MLASVLRRIVSGFAGMVLATMIISTSYAQTVADFVANPAQIMARFPAGGPQFISLIRDVATQQPGALQSIIGLLTTANADQQAAIGSGLGQAYQIVLQTDQTYAALIQEAILRSGNDNVQTAFSGATGGTLIGSTGGGGGSSGGGGSTGSGGIPSGGSNSGSTTTGSSSTPTSTATFTGGGSSVASSSSVSPR